MVEDFFFPLLLNTTQCESYFICVVFIWHEKYSLCFNTVNQTLTVVWHKWIKILEEGASFSYVAVHFRSNFDIIEYSGIFFFFNWTSYAIFGKKILITHDCSLTFTNKPDLLVDISAFSIINFYIYQFF